MLVKFSEFMAAIRKGELPHVFLLSGEEPYYIDKAKEALLGKLFPGGAGMADALQKVSGDMAIEDLLASIAVLCRQECHPDRGHESLPREQVTR